MAVDHPGCLEGGCPRSFSAPPSTSTGSYGGAEGEPGDEIAVRNNDSIDPNNDSADPITNNDSIDPNINNDSIDLAPNRDDVDEVGGDLEELCLDHDPRGASGG